MKKFLIVLDPLKKLYLKWDSTLFLARILHQRGHEVWAADVPDIRFESPTVRAQARRLIPHPQGLGFKESRVRDFNAADFDCILIRKEPPFDFGYLYLTYLLELIAPQVPISNLPQGIRNANEKLSSLFFEKEMPPTIVSASVQDLLNFRKKIKSGMVVKPLDQKGGHGVFLIPASDRRAADKIRQATRGNRFVMGQKFISAVAQRGEKRVFLLQDQILAVCEKRNKPGEFRANLGLGGTYHQATLNRQEKRVIGKIIPWLVDNGIHLSGIDIMQGKLLEINVTCPGGLVETTGLYPERKPVELWADVLESLQVSPMGVPKPRRKRARSR